MKTKSVRSNFTIYHNPRCSKSRATLELLQEHGVEPKIIEYLKSPPNPAALKSILAKLKLRPEQLIRKTEDLYKDLIAGKNLNDAQLIAAMVDNPILIERPIVVAGTRAALGRPPETVLTLLK